MEFISWIKHFAHSNLENVGLAGEVDNLLLLLMDGEFPIQGWNNISYPFAIEEIML